MEHPSKQAESAVLGAILKNPAILLEQGISLSEEHFGDPMHRELWSVMFNLEMEGTAIDLVSVSAYASKNPVSQIDATKLIGLTEDCPVTQNMNHYSDLVKKHYRTRRALEIISLHLSMGDSVNPEKTCEDLQTLIARTEVKINPFAPWGPVGQSIIDKIKSGAPIRSGHLKQSSFPKLNEMAPLHKGELVVIGAVTAGGKTAFTVNLCLGLANEGARGLYFFYESSKENLQLRVMSIMSEIPLSKITGGSLTPEEIKILENDADVLSDQVFYRDESKDGSVGNLINHVKSQLKKIKCDYIVIDHMHQMPVKGTMREGIIDITNKFLGLAKSEDIAVIALAQFRKPTQNEADKRPTANMIRESSTVAQDAHHVWILHDPEHLEKMAEEQGKVTTFADKYSTRGFQNSGPAPATHAEIIIEKNREGETGIIPARFNREIVSWSEI